MAIIGYPRCGNSFARRAIEYLQYPNSILIASHNHYVSQLKEAIQLNIPTLLLIRDPLNAASSWVVRNPEIPAREALLRYIWFYQSAYQHLDSVCLSEYSEITKYPEKVIQKINIKFSTTFSEREMKLDDFRILRDKSLLMEADLFADRLKATGISMSVPSTKKEELKSRIIKSIHRDFPSLAEKALKIYGKYRSYMNK